MGTGIEKKQALGGKYVFFLNYLLNFIILKPNQWISNEFISGCFRTMYTVQDSGLFYTFSCQCVEFTLIDLEVSYAILIEVLDTSCKSGMCFNSQTLVGYAIVQDKNINNRSDDQRLNALPPPSLFPLHGSVEQY